MDYNQYRKIFYMMTAKQSPDELTVDKMGDSDYCEISMVTNGFGNGQVTIRSKEMAEQLHFMLGQMLGK